MARARAAGYDPGDAGSMSRRTPAGDLLEWRLTPDRPAGVASVVPFLIDWGHTPHPSGDLAADLRLVALTLVTPDPDAVRRVLDALGFHPDRGPGGMTVNIEAGSETALRAELVGRDGARQPGRPTLLS